MPRSLYPQGKRPWYPLVRRLGWPQSRSVRGGEEINFHPLSGLEPPIIQPLAQRYTTGLSLPLSLSLSLSLSIYIYIYMCVCVCLYWYYPTFRFQEAQFLLVGNGLGGIRYMDREMKDKCNLMAVILKICKTLRQQG
jgi:hypothetical protein